MLQKEVENKNCPHLEYGELAHVSLLQKINVLVSVVLLWQAPWPKAMWGRKGFAWPLYSHLSREVRAGTKGRNLEAGPEAVAMEGHCLLPGSCSGYLSYTEGAHLPRMPLPTVGQGLLYPSSIRTMSTDLPIWGRWFCKWESLFSDMSSWQSG